MISYNPLNWFASPTATAPAVAPSVTAPATPPVSDSMDSDGTGAEEDPGLWGSIKADASSAWDWASGAVSSGVSAVEAVPGKVLAPVTSSLVAPLAFLAVAALLVFLILGRVERA